MDPAKKRKIGVMNRLECCTVTDIDFISPLYRNIPQNQGLIDFGECLYVLKRASQLCLSPLQAFLDLMLT